MSTENKIEEKKHSSAKEPYKSAKTKSTQLLTTNSLGEKSLIKALRREKGVLQHPEQNRTTLNKNWVKKDHAKEKGREETLLTRRKRWFIFFYFFF